MMPNESMIRPADLVGFWSKLGTSKVHPADQAVLPKSDFETALHPLPWVGPLRSARVYILLLNPGLSPQDKFYERRKSFQEALGFNLQGRGPYLYLLNKFADHPGHGWARRVFGSEVTEVHSDQICVLQLVPYHSRTGEVASKIAPRLRSSQIAVEFLHSWLLPEARAGRIGLIAARASRLWNLDEEKDGKRLVIYRGWECRGALQTSETRGGKLLQKVLSQ